MGCTCSNIANAAAQNPDCLSDFRASSNDSCLRDSSDFNFYLQEEGNTTKQFVFNSIICGDIFDNCERVCEKVSPALRLFLSSTFTDTQLERNIAINQLLSDLKDEARSYGIELGLVDMRWGVQDENTMHHRTWVECSREIRRCRDQSSGLFFISLQSDKYGYRSLPRYIPKDLFDGRCSQRSKTHPEFCELARAWYSLDENVIPAVYVLRSLKSLNDNNYWTDVLPNLLSFLEGLPFEIHDGGIQLLVGQSITEWELKFAYSSHLQASRLFWFHRHFVETESLRVPLPAGIIERFCDGLGKELIANKLSSLIKWMHERPFSDGNKKTYDLPSHIILADQLATQEWVDYGQRWAGDMKKLISSALLGLRGSCLAWQRDACGIGLPGADADEMLRHYQWAAIKLHDFIGRQKLVDAVCKYVFEEKKENAAALSTSNTSLRAIDIAVIGSSGTGKTALMAKVASDIYKRQKALENGHPFKQRPVIVRFCGTSPGSTNGFALVKSICQQIQHLVGIGTKRQDGRESLGQTGINTAQQLVTYKSACTLLAALLKEHPVVLVIDSLDQLSNDYLARNDISFLKSIDTHEHTRIIVSALPDEWAGEKEGMYCYGCESKLAEAGIPRVTVPPLQLLRGASGVLMSEAELTFAHLLKVNAGRKLTHAQHEYAVSKILAEPTALYIRLAVEVVKDWTSTQPAESLRLDAGVRPIIDQILEKFESNYGSVLTRAALGFLTFAVDGVNDSELEDLLSLHSQVMSINGVLQYCQSVSRLPSHVWLRLRGELFGLITEREDGRLTWYHRQLREAAEIRFKAEKLMLSRIMARYFGNLIDEDERRSVQVVSQPLMLCGDTSDVWREDKCEFVNNRRCVESVTHMINADMIMEASHEICTLESVCARARCGQLFTAVSQLSKLVAVEPNNALVEHYFRLLLKHAHRINKRPGINSISAAASGQPKVSLVRSALRNTLSVSSNIVEAASVTKQTLVANSMVYETPADFGDVLQIIEGHSSGVRAVAYFDGKIVSGSSDKTVCIWDASTGTLINTLQGHTYGVLCLAVGKNGLIIVTGSSDETVRVWNAVTGTTIHVLKGHSGAINAVVINSYGLIVSASSDHSVRVWDIGSKLGICVGTSDPIGEKFILNGHSRQVNAIALSLDGTKVASGGLDTTVCVWNIETGVLLSTMRGMASAVTALAFADSGQAEMTLLLSGSDDKIIRVWHLESEVLLYSLSGHDGSIQSLAINPTDNSCLISAGVDSKILQWDLIQGVVSKSFTGHTGCVYAAIFNEDGRKIISASYDQTVTVWKMAGKGANGKVTPNNISCVEEGDISTDGESHHTALAGHQLPVRSVGVTADGGRFISCSDDKTVRICDIASGHPAITVLVDIPSCVLSVCFSPDGRLFACSSRSGDVIVCSSSTGEMKNNYLGHTSAVKCVTFSPNGLLIAACSGLIILIWEVESCDVVTTFTEHTNHVNSLAFDSSSNVLISGACDYNVCLWSVETKSLMKVCSGHSGNVNSVACNPFRSKVASASSDCTIRLWEAYASRSPSRKGVDIVLKGHTSAVSCVAFSRDGTKLASSAEDKTIRLWDSFGGSALAVLYGHTHYVHAVAWGQSGQLVSGSEDRTVRVWQCMSSAAPTDHSTATVQITPRTPVVKQQSIKLLPRPPSTNSIDAESDIITHAPGTASPPPSPPSPPLPALSPLTTPPEDALERHRRATMVDSDDEES